MTDHGRTESVNTADRPMAADALKRALDTIHSALMPHEICSIQEVIDGLRDDNTIPTN